MPASIDKSIRSARDKLVVSGLYHHCSEGLVQLDGHIKLRLFDNDPSRDRYPAVDLCAGLGVLTTNFALRYRQPAFPASLDFYPTDPNPDLTKSGLECMAQDAKTPPIFKDPDGEPVYAGDQVQLRGLSAEKYNQREGQVVCPDQNQPGRFAIRLLDDKRTFEPKKISLKSQNLFALPCPELENAVLRAMPPSEQDQFFQDLIDRTCKFDLKQTNTWKNIEHLRGKCALVTCIDARSKYRDTTWRDAMEVASRLLMEGGYLVISDEFDLFEGDGYANMMAMDEFVLASRLPLTLQGWSEPFGDDKPMLWRKVDSMAEMEQMSDSNFLVKLNQFRPEMPPTKKKEEEAENID